MRPLDRRSPSLINGAWGQRFMWDGRAASLEDQAPGPIQAPTEMNQPLDRLIDILSAIPRYLSLFAAAFPGKPITQGAIADAIATCERTIVSTIAPFDAWIENDAAAFPQPARRGFALFNTKARCASCHDGWRLTDNGFQDIGLPDNDEGRGRLFPHVIKMSHAFKTPGPREIARRGPYMHDGSLPALEAVVAHYDRGGGGRPGQSESIAPLGRSPEEQADIAAFLRTLSSDVRPGFVPDLPR
ncbi:MAG: c-type cytochrome [Acetobacteraceae bacterium]|nr:c-type cytochrome [Acetobacteraceae bacterium]